MAYSTHFYYVTVWFKFRNHHYRFRTGFLGATIFKMRPFGWSGFLTIAMLRYSHHYSLSLGKYAAGMMIYSVFSKKID